MRAIEEVDPLLHRVAVPDPQPQPAELLEPGRHEHGVDAARQVEERGPIDRMFGHHSDAETEDAAYLPVQHVLGKPELRNACSQEPADLRTRLVDRHAVAQPGQLIRRRESGRPRADDGDLLSPARQRLDRGLPRISREALELAHVHGAVQLYTVAGIHARRRADSPADRRKGRRTKQDLESSVRVIPGERMQEALHVVARRAYVIARRDELLPLRLLRGPLAGLDPRQPAACPLQEAGRPLGGQER